MKFDFKLESLVAPGLNLEFYLVPWDSEIFGFNVAQISHIHLEQGVDARPAFRRFEEWRDERRVRLISCRMAHDRLPEAMFLEEHGFRFIEMVYHPEKRDLATVDHPADELQIERARAADLPAIEAIAESAFDTGRFLLDWRLDPALSKKRYKVWVTNSFSDAKHSVLKASLSEEIVGFFITEYTAEQRAYWHLTAVAPGWQGKGIGRRLWQAMMMRNKHDGMSSIGTTISAHNAPVINLYARLGFSFSPPETTFHWVRA